MILPACDDLGTAVDSRLGILQQPLPNPNVLWLILSQRYETDVKAQRLVPQVRQARNRNFPLDRTLGRREPTS